MMFYLDKMDTVLYDRDVLSFLFSGFFVSRAMEFERGCIREV